jgi:hypothetical protein
LRIAGRIQIVDQIIRRRATHRLSDPVAVPIVDHRHSGAVLQQVVLEIVGARGGTSITVSARSLRFLPGLLRGHLSDEISCKVKLALLQAASFPTLRNVREEWGTHFRGGLKNNQKGWATPPIRTVLDTY